MLISDQSQLEIVSATMMIRLSIEVCIKDLDYRMTFNTMIFRLIALTFNTAFSQVSLRLKSQLEKFQCIIKLKAENQ